MSTFESRCFLRGRKRGKQGRRTAGVIGLIVLFVAGVSPLAMAVPYYGDEVFTYHQPDGSIFGVRLYGDEFFAYQRTADEGREVVRDETTGFWCYAKLSADGESFVSTGVPVVTADTDAATCKSKAISAGAAEPFATLPPDVVLARVTDNKETFDVAEKDYLAAPGVEKNGLDGPGVTGSVIGLCILVDFPDEEHTVSQADMARFMNQPSNYKDFGNACSVNEYFYIESNGKLNYTNLVTEYVRMPYPKDYYDDDSVGDAKADELVETALSILMDQGFDFTKLSRDGDVISAISVFYAGRCEATNPGGLMPRSNYNYMVVDEENNIWAGPYLLSPIGNMPHIGGACRLTGYMLCGFHTLGSIVNNYCMMGHIPNSLHPPHFSPMFKAKAGWADIVEVTYNSESMHALLQTDRNRFYKYPNPEHPGEYYLLENRSDMGYEGPYGGASASAPGTGLVVWHVNENGSNINSSIQDAYLPEEEKYKRPFYAFVVEATPSGANDTGKDAWYGNPGLLPDENDTFHSNQGADPVHAHPPLPNNRMFTNPQEQEPYYFSHPDLCFWNWEDFSVGRDRPSKLVLHSFGEPGYFMPFIIGVEWWGWYDWEVLNVLGPPAIDITCSSIAARCDYRQNPPDQLFRVFNKGGDGTLEYTVEAETQDGNDWLIVPEGQYFAETGGEDFTVSFDATNLDAGDYTGTITIDSHQTPLPLEIDVSLNVAEQSELVVYPEELNVTVESSEATTDNFINILNNGGGLMKYTLSSECLDAPWVWLDPVRLSGLCIGGMQETAYFRITPVDVTQTPPILPMGDYTGDVTVTAPGALGSPQSATVNLSVGGLIAVVSPNGGEVWEPTLDRTVPIVWGTNTDEAVSIQLVKWDEGASTYVVVEDIASAIPYDGDPDGDGRSTYTWPLPPDIGDGNENIEPGADYRVRVFTGTNWDTAEFRDESDVDFRIFRTAYKTDMNEEPLEGEVPGWTFEGDWAWGTPTGKRSNESIGNPDPTSGYSGDTLIGYQLGDDEDEEYIPGDYENNLQETEYATLGPIDCTDFTDTKLTFRRWLGVEKTDSAVIEISTDGETWSEIWNNQTPLPDEEDILDITDGDGGEWTLVTYDISDYADEQPSVWLRWGMGPTDDFWRSCGWNIDDLAVYGKYPTGSLQVTLEPPEAIAAGARWRRVGTETWLASGHTEDHIPFGPWTIEFSDVPDWVSPDPMSVTIEEGMTTQETGTYYQVGLLQVTIEPPEAVDAGAQWRLADTETWFDSADPQELPVGDYVIEFKPVDLWRVPEAIEVTVESGQLTTAVAEYYQRGSLEVLIEPEDVPAGATWQWRRVDTGDTSDWLESGHIEVDIPVGPYHIEFSSVELWREPGIMTVAVNPDETTTVVAEYVQKGSLQVTIEPAAAVTAGARWRRVGTDDWFESGVGEEDIEVGSYALEFEPVDLWRTPDPITVTIEPEEATTETVNYYQAGSLQVTIEPADAVAAGAQWRVDGGPWQDTEAIVEDLVVGDHIVTFRDDLPDWAAPADVSVTIEPEEMATASGTYYQAGSLQVTIQPAEAVAAGAQWRVDGGPWQDTEAIVEDLDIGSHTVEFKSLDGWYAPSNQVVTITHDHTTEVTGEYEEIKYGSLQVLITPDGVIEAGAQWRRVGTATWHDSGYTEEDLPEGDYSVEFKTLDGWETPAEQPVTVVEDETAALTGVYIEIIETGSLQVTIDPAEARRAGAQWRRVGTTIWRNPSYIENEVPVDECAIEFSFVNGWIEPEPLSVTIETDERTTATGTYVEATGSIEVMIEPQGAKDDGAMWRRVASVATKSENAPASGNVFIIGDPVLNEGVLEVPLVLFRGDDVTSQDTFTEDGLFTGGPAPAVFGFDVVYDPAVLSFSNEAAGSVNVSANLRNWYGHEVTVSEPEGPNNGRVRLVFVDSAYNRPVTTADNVREGGNPEAAQNPFVLATMSFVCSLDANASSPLLIENLVATDGEEMLETAAAQPALVKVDSGSDWFPSGHTETEIQPGDYAVEFKEVTGWETPPDIAVEIEHGETTTETGTYGEIPSGLLRVTIEPREAVDAGAQWRRVGTEEWRESGTAEKRVPEGEYEVEFSDVDGWNTPENQTVTIVANETAEVLAEYAVIIPTGSLQVTIRPAEAVSDGAQWRRVDTEEWLDSGATESGLRSESYTVEFKPVSGWDEPEDISITVEVNDTQNLLAAYTAETKPWACPLLDNKALEPFAEASVYEPVMPSPLDENGVRSCAPLGPLAVRLRSNSPIDPATVWGVVSWTEAASEEVLWLPLDGAQSDGWAVYEPETPWADGEVVTFTAGAYTVSGHEVGPFTYEFVVSEEVYEGSVAVIESGATTSEPEFVGTAYEIAPSTVYFEPLTIQLPVPDGVDAAALEPAYLFTEDGGSRWVDGRYVEGWLEPGSVRVVQDKDRVYIEFQANHAGTVQLRRRAMGVSSAGMSNALVSGDLLVFLGLVAFLLFQKRLWDRRLWDRRLRRS